MPRSIHKCPQCGENVSAFAAGCAVCGADLVTARRDLSERRAKLPHTKVASRVPTVSFGGDGFQIGVALLLAIAAPFFGAIAAAYLAWVADNEGRIRTRNVMLVILVIALIPLATGYGLLGRFIVGY